MSSSSGRTRVLVVAVAASSAFVALGVVFANVTTASRVADNARELHWTNAGLGTAALARAAAGQAELFTELTEQGAASPQAAAVADVELDRTTTALAELAADGSGRVADELEGLVAVLSTEPLDFTVVDDRYSRVVEVLTERIGEIEAQIEESERLADRVSAVIRLLVTLVLPITAILIYRRRAGEQLRASEVRMEAQLAAAEAIARAKDEFVAGMSHEIRTPLTGIYGFSQLLLESPPEATLDRELIAVIHQEADDLSRMVDDFIAVSRVDGPGIEMTFEPVDLVSVATAVADRFRRRGGTVEVTGGEVVARCDQGRLTQLLTNLVANAFHHGGPHILIAVETQGDSARCRVIDDGHGVPAEMRERLFKRFVHEGTKPLTSGTLGLGTWVAQELARRMEGEVSYERDDDVSVFTVTLPVPKAGPSLPRGSLTAVGR